MSVGGAKSVWTWLSNSFIDGIIGLSLFTCGKLCYVSSKGRSGVAQSEERP